MDLLEPIWVAHHAQLAALSAALHRFGFTTIIMRDNEHQDRPCVWLRCGAHQEFIYAAPDDDQRWWFWWGTTMVPIAPDVEVSKTADSIIRRLERLGLRGGRSDGI